MNIWNALKELKQLIHDLRIRMDRVESQTGKFATDGSTPKYGDTGGAITGTETGITEINVDNTPVLNDQGNTSTLAGSVVWDPDYKNEAGVVVGQWKFYAVYKD